MEKLFTTLYGSKLYGTSTPTSDRDVKHIVLPSLSQLLLGKKVETKVKKTNTELNTRNTKDDVDEEFIPVQVFARDFMHGQTYAIELAFATDGTHAEQSFSSKNGKHFHTFVRVLRKNFLTSNIKAMMGYVVNQASLYSFKGERLNAVKAVKSALNNFLDQNTQENVKMNEAYQFAELKRVTEEFPKYCRYEMYDIGGGVLRPCLKLLEKTLPFTDRVEHSLTVVDALMKKYGSRAESAANTAEGGEKTVDWKATMHALRIVDEGLELLGTGKLTLPLPPEQVEKLLSIKRGEVPLEVVSAELSDKLDVLKALEKTTKLPALTQEMEVQFEEFLVAWMETFYGLEQLGLEK